MYSAVERQCSCFATRLVMPKKCPAKPLGNLQNEPKQPSAEPSAAAAASTREVCICRASQSLLLEQDTLPEIPDEESTQRLHQAAAANELPDLLEEPDKAPGQHQPRVPAANQLGIVWEQPDEATLQPHLLNEGINEETISSKPRPEDCSVSCTPARSAKASAAAGGTCSALPMPVSSLDSASASSCWSGSHARTKRSISRKPKDRLSIGLLHTEPRDAAHVQHDIHNMEASLADETSLRLTAQRQHCSSSQAAMHSGSQTWRKSWWFASQAQDRVIRWLA